MHSQLQQANTKRTHSHTRIHTTMRTLLSHWSNVIHLFILCKITPSVPSPMTTKVGSKGYPRHPPHSGTGSNASGGASQSNTENIDPNLLETPSAPLKGKGAPHRSHPEGLHRQGHYYTHLTNPNRNPYCRRILVAGRWQGCIHSILTRC